VNFKIVNPFEDSSWDDQLLKLKSSSIFHASPWAKVLSESYKYTPKYFVNYKDDTPNLIWPLMEISSYLTGKRGVSLPFTDYCPPLFSNEIKIKDVAESILEYGRIAHWKYIEFRGGSSAFNQSHKSSFYLHTLDLMPGVDRIFELVHKTTKRNIRKATREGVQVEFFQTSESLREYYDLHCLTRKRHGLPPQPGYFFDSIFDNIISKNLGFVVLARVNTKTIAGAIYFHFGDKAIYKYGASDMSHQYLRPNNLVMWEAIKWYASNNFKSFSFGRTDCHHEGLRRFKISWGSQEKIIKYFRYNVMNKTYYPETISKESGAQNIYKKMPIFISKFIGNSLYKHVG
jgi:hypothetical protein